MYSATLTSSLHPSFLTSSTSSLTNPSKYRKIYITQIQFEPRSQNPNILLPTSLKCTKTPCSKSYDYAQRKRNPVQISSNNVNQKLQLLVTEFKSLTESIDRVKRLLHYATFLPVFDESARSEENRVTGCTAQVWLEVTIDFEGLMRFRVDSDSEITKGFCSCLIWLLDGAVPEEVVAVKAEDLAAMNVGILPANSRVNTWNTVLNSMQKRTKALMAQRFTHPQKPPLEPYPCLVATTPDIRARGRFDQKI